MSFSSGHEMKKTPDLVDDFFKHVLHDEEPFFVSDEAKIWDVSLATPEELIRRCSEYYRISVSLEDFKQPLWKLLPQLVSGRNSA